MADGLHAEDRRSSGSLTWGGLWLGSTRSRLLAALLYAVAFFVVAGPSGQRIPLRLWALGAPSGETPPGPLIGQLLVAAAVGLASTMLAVVAGGVIRRSDRPGAWTRWPLWPWAVGLALAMGCAAQGRLANDSTQVVIPVLLALLGVLAVGPVLARAVGSAGSDPRRTMRLGLVVGGVAVLVRAVGPLLAGNPASGSIGGIAVGEVTRAAAAVAAALSLAGARQQVVLHASSTLRRGSLWLGLLGRLAPGLAMVAVLVFFRDYGPAAILGATLSVLALLAYTRAHWWRAAGVTALGAVAMGVLGSAVNRVTGGGLAPVEHVARVVENRWSNAVCTGEKTQACMSLRVLHETGILPQVREWGSAQPSGSALVRHLEVAGSDYAITLTAAWVGMGLVVILMAGILAVGLRVFLASVEQPPADERAHLRVRVGAVCALQLLLPTILLGLAILVPRIPFTSLKLVPLTGLDVPFIAANGISTLVYSALLTLGVLISRGRLASGPAVVLPGNLAAAGRLLRGLVLGSTALLTVGAIWIHAGWAAAGSTRLVGEALLRDSHGRLLTSDGVVFSEPNAAGQDPGVGLGSRLYPNPDLAVDLGFFMPTTAGNLAVGLERLAAPLLTCGDFAPRGSLDLAAECTGADVIATIDSRVQRLAAAAADAQATAGARADVALIDRRTGGVVALASSDADDEDMQALITRAPDADDWSPPSLLAAADEGAAAPEDPDWSWRKARFAIEHLSEANVHCVKPRTGSTEDGKRAVPVLANPRPPGDPWSADEPDDLGPSRKQCAADKSGLAIMRVWSEASQPGSSFKVVTALASLDEGTGVPAGPITSPLTAVGGVRLEGRVEERDALKRCGAQSLDWMLLQSCNTTAAWLGISAGWPALGTAAQELGFDPADDERRQSDEGGAVVGPADPSDPAAASALVYYRSSDLGMDPQDRTAVQADGKERRLGVGAVAHATGMAAIGQDEVRASVLDMAGVTHAIVGAGPLSGPSGPASTASQVQTEYVKPPVLNMIAGSRDSDGQFHASAYPTRAIAADPDSLALVRRGMWWAVNHPSGTASRLRPGAQAGGRPLGELDVIWAKTGSADLGLTSGAGEDLWARWAIGATDKYVFAARVKDTTRAGGANPAVDLVKCLFKGMGQEPVATDVEAGCAQ
ncbi:MAG: penicillin-binding transpeptidase domain-containing protein [Candidatus Nanopelagicales bacterium]